MSKSSSSGCGADLVPGASAESCFRLINGHVDENTGPDEVEMEANLHALGMIGIHLATFWALWHFRKPVTPLRSWWREALARFGYAVGAFTVVMVAVMVSVPVFKSGFSPNLQMSSSVLSAIIVAIAANRGRVRLSLVALQIVGGIALGNHYTHLANDKTACRYTGPDVDFIGNSCNRPARSAPLWHSSFTGIHEVRLR